MSTTGVDLDFAACRERLERAVAAACEQHQSWATSVVASIRAALEFAVEEPAAAELLTDRAKARWAQREPELTALVEHFAALLRRGAPQPHPRLPSPEMLIVCIAEQVNLRIRAGRVEELLESAPDLTFLALMPFLGFDGARQWAQLTPTS